METAMHILIFLTVLWALRGRGTGPEVAIICALVWGAARIIVDAVKEKK